MLHRQNTLRVADPVDRPLYFVMAEIQICAKPAAPKPTLRLH